MSLLLDPFVDNLFMQRALLAGLLVALACGVVGTFVVLRGLAFIGDALAHGVLPGVAAAALLGWPGLVGAVVGALAMIGGVRLVTRHTRLSTDTAIGLLFVGMLALGVLMVSRSRSFTGDLVNILFGEVLGIGADDLAVQALATVAVLVTAAVCTRPFLLLCVDAELADVSGFRAGRYHTIMLLLIAVTVVVSFQTVGTLLVFGMLLAPAGTAALLVHRVGSMMAVAVGIGAACVVAGLLLSYHADLAGGAAIVLCAVAVFFVVLLTQAAVRAVRTRRPAAVA